MLKYTGIKRELITDVNMHQIIENGIRGGICQVIVQYAEGNNEHTNKTLIKILIKQHLLMIMMQIISMDLQCVKNYHDIAILELMRYLLSMKILY